MNSTSLIKSRRIELGLSQAELGRMVGVSESAICRWESGNIANMRRDRIYKLAQALRLDPATLIQDDAPVPEPVSKEDEELNEYLDMLRSRPECRMLLKTMAGATKAEVEENVRIIETIRGYRK